MLILGGGGFKGLAQLGYVSVDYHKPDRIVGISVGALIGLLLLLDYTPHLIFKLACGLLRIGALPLDLHYHPLSCMSDQVLHDTLGALLAHRGWSLDTPYAEFRQTVPWDALVHCLTCRATVLVSDPVENWSNPDQPSCIDIHHWSIWEVVRASLSYPVCFAPVQKQHVYVDGMTSVYSQFLLTQYVHEQGPDALCVLLIGQDQPNQFDTTPDYIQALIRSQFVAWDDTEFVAWRRTIWSEEQETRSVDIISCPITAFDATAIQADVQLAVWQCGVAARQARLDRIASRRAQGHAESESDTSTAS